MGGRAVIVLAAVADGEATTLGEASTTGPGERPGGNKPQAKTRINKKGSHRRIIEF